MKWYHWAIIFGIVVIAIIYCFTNDKQTNYQHMVVDINDHYVYFTNTKNVGGYSDAKHTQLKGIGGISSNSVVLYENEPDQRCYEYTATEFAEHVCGPDADWRCPHSGHETIE